MNKKLGICITTFNRAEVLKDVLDIMVPLARQAQVGIYVNDNASTDGTADVLKHFSREYEFFFPFTQATNVGFDINYAECMLRCEAEYCWGWLITLSSKKGRSSACSTSWRPENSTSSP